MDIHHLKIFISVYKNLSFTLASEALHISQPTISEHIKNLEAELAIKLFDRMGRSILPTQEADILYPGALQLLDDLTNLLDKVSASAGGVKGRILFGASTIPGAYLLPSEAHTFKQRFPDIFFEILIEDSKKVTDMVLNHDLLCGIVGAKMESAKLSYTPLIEDELVLVAAKDVTGRKTVKPFELKTLPLLVREIGSGTRQTIENYLARKKISLKNLNIVATLGSASSIRQAVKAGLGASILSRIAVQEELDCEQLREIPILGMKMKRNFYLVKLKKRSLPFHYESFCRQIIKAKK